MPPEVLITPERLRAGYGVGAVIGAVTTPAGERQVCAPLLEGDA